MAAYFLDTSALIKRHVNETGSKWVRSLTLLKAPAPLFISHITAVEVFSAITRRQRGGSLSAAQAAAILGHFRRHLKQRYNVLEGCDRASAKDFHEIRAVFTRGVA